jgi:hypothetical protein
MTDLTAHDDRLELIRQIARMVKLEQQGLDEDELDFERETPLSDELD